jgi:hypothetical protein
MGKCKQKKPVLLWTQELQGIHSHVLGGHVLAFSGKSELVDRCMCLQFDVSRCVMFMLEKVDKLQVQIMIDSTDNDSCQATDCVLTRIVNFCDLPNLC